VAVITKGGQAVRPVAATQKGPAEAARHAGATKSDAVTTAGQVATAPVAPASKSPTKVASAKKTAAEPSKQTRPTLNTDRLYKGLDWKFCGPRPARLGPAKLPPEPSAEDQLYLSADTFDYDQELSLLWLQGDVELAQGSRHIAGDEVVYDRSTADLAAKGDVYLANPGARLVAKKGQMNLKSDKGNLSDVHYRLWGKINARGEAARAELVDPTLTRYEDIVYTTCRPGQDAWALAASELELDQAAGWGKARDAKLRIRGVPVLYTPYISFPIDDRRKSGFLVPSVGSSNKNGIDVTAPYYWNIAPNMDATIAPRLMSKRGLMLGTEFRYLSALQGARIYGEILPDDREMNNDTRWALHAQEAGHFAQRWTTDLDFNAVSDDRYLSDFGNQLTETSTRNLERRGDLTYQGDGWSLRTRLQDFQTVDATIPPANRPYGQLPELTLTTTPYALASGLKLGVGAEYDYFTHDTNVYGQRVAMQPYVSWPLRRSWGYLIPRLNFYMAGYDLRDQAPGKDTHPSYAIPSFNLDARLVFERGINWLHQDALQTLEPRIFYLYTPYKDQSDQPVFDSSNLSLSYYNLFQPNRFTGWDRIGDASQITLALTSRTLSRDSGEELLQASIGQTLYFRDRDVQIAGPPQDAPSSPIAGILGARLLQSWMGFASFEYDPNEATDPSLKRSLEVHYQAPDNDRLLNLAYRFDLGTSEATRYENTDLSFRLPVSDRLKLVGYWNYSLLWSQTVEALAGIEYGRCCWRLRLVGQHLQSGQNSAGSTSLMVQVELAGLGAIGQRIDELLERNIYGYQADYGYQ
jgi:LPS-assembly protein